MRINILIIILPDTDPFHAVRPALDQSLNETLQQRLAQMTELAKLKRTKYCFKRRNFSGNLICFGVVTSLG